MRRPDFSVILANRNSGAAVDDCLQSLINQSFSGTTELLVADCSLDGTGTRIKSQFPAVKLLHYSKPVPIAHMFGRALREAKGDVVAVTDPNCRFPQDWLTKLSRAHNSNYDVIGGAVENRWQGGVVGWACYFADYGSFMLPATRCQANLLAGNHVSYKRTLLEQHRDLIRGGYRKVFFHQELARRGIRFLFDPELIVHYVCPYDWSSFATEYYHRGKAFAAKRSEYDSTARLLRLLSVPALPPLLLCRRLHPILTKGRHIGKLLASIPALAAFVTAWSVGEFVAYLKTGSAQKAEIW